MTVIIVDRNQCWQQVISSSPAYDSYVLLTHPSTLIIPTAAESFCHTNVNKCCVWVFWREMIDAVVFMGGQSVFSMCTLGHRENVMVEVSVSFRRE